MAPITDADVAVVADFLHANSNSRVSSSTWSRAAGAVGGKPDTVNNLAAAALIATCAARKTIVDHGAARTAIAEVVTTD